MIPLRLATRSDESPWMTRAITLALVVVFGVQFVSAPIGEALIRIFGFVPARLLAPELFGYSPLESAVTLLSSLFLHGGFVHITGNLIYLWVFGAAVEQALGHGRFAILYFASGIAGSLLHAAIFPNSMIPSIGASGCIAGVLGAFLVLRPREPIVTLIPLIVSWILVEIPGLVLLPIWFALQFMSGLLALKTAASTEEVAGVAWWAHIGGFGLGMMAGAVGRIAARRAALKRESEGDG